MSTKPPLSVDEAMQAGLFPRLGATVHYVAYGTPSGEFPRTCRAAIVTAVPSELGADGETLAIDLMVCNPQGLFFNRGIRYSEDITQGGTWHWPER